jgi:hypothetical protein
MVLTLGALGIVFGDIGTSPRLFVWMAHATDNRTEDLHLPPERTIVIGARLDL